MEIFINSIGRENKQVTINYLEKKNLNVTTLVTTKNEYSKYKKSLKGIVKIEAMPKKLTGKGLSKQRQWVFDELATENYICFLDDDLNFYRRKDKKLKKCSKRDFSDLLTIWENWLIDNKQIGIVGVSARGGNNFVEDSYDECCRLMSAYMFKKNILLKNNIRFDRVKLRQDFDVVLSLLENGYKNRVSYDFAHEQAFGSGTEGGCSEYRTPELMESEAILLRKLHPAVISIVQKETKSGWDNMKTSENGMRIRTDVKVQWKKAYKKNNTKSILKFL